MDCFSFKIKPGLFFLLFFFGSFYTHAFTDNYGKILDVQDDARLTSNSDCSVDFFLRLNIAYQDDMDTSNLLPMYLEYEIENGPSGLIPISIKDFQDYGQKIQDQTILEYRLPLSMEVDLECSSTNSFFLEYSLKLLTVKPSGPPNSFYYYPVKDYSTSGDFFPCNLFDHSFGQVSPPPGCIRYTFPSVNSGLFEIICKQCGDTPEPTEVQVTKVPHDSDGEQAPPPRDGSENPFHSGNEEQLSNLKTIQFFPNPFDSQLAVPFVLEEEGTLELNIFDATGKRMHQQTALFNEGFHRIDLDTHNWSEGIYYAQVKSDNFTQSYRLVKID